MLLDFVALSLLPINWWRDLVSRLRAGASASELLEASCERSRPQGLPRATVADLRARASEALARAQPSGIEPIAWSDPRYPPPLAAIIDPPPVLWLRGRVSVFDAPSIAIVGSRAGSPYALAVAEQLAGDLAERGMTIVSGLARGVDSAAHRGALGAKGATIAVLGSGPDIVYPSEHKPLVREMMAKGAVLSELVPGTPPQPHFFPRRNRIISGLARAVVVVEAGEKSGSLITAHLALEQGRDVLAVPGSILNGRNRGGHALLRDGAKIVESADDILEEVGFAPVRQRPGIPVAESADPVLRSLPAGEPCGLDAIAERSGLPTERILPRLFELELQGFLRRLGGGRFMRVDRSC